MDLVKEAVSVVLFGRSPGQYHLLFQYEYAFQNAPKAVDSFEGVYQDYKAGKISASEGARKLGIARSTWYRKVKQYEEQGERIDF